MAQTTDLVKLDKAKAVLSIDGTSEDVRLAHLISSVSLELEHRLGCAFIQRNFTDKKEGGRKRIYLDRLPIVSVTSITDPAANTVAATDYVIRQDRYLEAIGFFDHAVTAQGQRADWTIIYKAGWFATTTAVTEEIQQEVLRVIDVLRQAPSPTATSVRVGDLAVTYGSIESSEGQTLLDQARNILIEYAGRLY